MRKPRRSCALILQTKIDWRTLHSDCAWINVKAKGPIRLMQPENSSVEVNYLKTRVKGPSAMSRLAIVLFSVGLALLIVSMVTR